MGGEADHGAVVEEVTCGAQGDVLLPDMEHRSPGNTGNIGAVVDGPQPPVPLGNFVQNLQDLKLFGGLERLVAKLDDVYAALERGVDEVFKIALPFAGIGAQVETGSGVDIMLGHGNQSSSSKLGTYCGSRDSVI
jgi:hypothetical protein